MLFKDAKCDYDSEKKAKAVKMCDKCGRFLCKTCGYNIDDTDYCNTCYCEMSDIPY